MLQRCADEPLVAAHACRKSLQCGKAPSWGPFAFRGSVVAVQHGQFEFPVHLQPGDEGSSRLFESTR